MGSTKGFMTEYMEERYGVLGTSTIAKMLGVSQDTIIRWTKKGKFIQPTSIDGYENKMWYDKAAVMEWIERMSE